MKSDLSGEAIKTGSQNGCRFLFYDSSFVRMRHRGLAYADLK